MVTLEEKGSIQVELLPLVPKHDMRELRGTYQQLTAKTFYEDTATDDYLHIILTDEEDVPEAMGRLQTIYPNLLKLTYDNLRTRSNNVIQAAVDVQQKSPLTLFSELYELQNNQPISEIQRSFLENLIESIWEDHK